MKKLLALLLCISTSSVYGAFTNIGTVSGHSLHLSYGTLENSGLISATDSIALITDTLTGSGTLSAPKITIHTAVFAFNGTIDCSESCTIIAKAPFNPSSFTRKGKGEFSVIIDPNFSKGFKIKPFKDKIEELLDEVLEMAE